MNALIKKLKSRWAAIFVSRKFWLGISIVTLISTVFSWELQSSKIQAHYFAKLTPEMITKMGPGPSPVKILSPTGPYDQRLGYAYLPIFSQKLSENQFGIARQTQPSTHLLEWVQKGFYPIYTEKTQAGLRVNDRQGKIIYAKNYPQRVFTSFFEIPPIIVNMLLFIENRNLLDPTRPFANPAVDWVRLSNAILQKAQQLNDPQKKVQGGSTLATQLEKLRHSDGGITPTVREKFIQMVSASLRAYMDGENTLAARRRIVLDYINSTPLAARRNFGEIFGLGDGLWAWYGRELSDIIQILNTPTSSRDVTLIMPKALALKQVLSLFLAHKKPSIFLLKDRASLIEKCNRFIHLLAHERLISQRLKTAMLAAPLTFREYLPPITAQNLIERKAAAGIRNKLQSLLDVDQLYTIDRVDMSVESTIDLSTQSAVTRELMKLHDADWIARNHFNSRRMLAQGDLQNVICSFTLYEKTSQGNFLRVQTDNFAQPFNVNEGLKLDLGSTAKLRTLIHYLEIIADLHKRFSDMAPENLRQAALASQDKLSRWARSYILTSHNKTLSATLLAAMERRYSASPYEEFFTGGGLHRFENFNKKDNRRRMSVREGFRRSVNLVFVRLMRDIVRYHMYGDSLTAISVLQDRNHPQRMEYLIQFADWEGTQFLKKFYEDYRHRSSVQIWQHLLKSVPHHARSLAAVYRYVWPERDPDMFRQFLHDQMPGGKWHKAKITSLYQKFSPDRLSLNNRSYIANIHPLELWLAAYLHRQPSRSLEDVLAASLTTRQDAYRWLFRTSVKRKQDKRIRIMLEREAFVVIHQAWQRLGYPFRNLVASYATALGSSADRPEALAELMGIIANDGVHQAAYRIREIKFAINTPYEVHYVRQPIRGQRALKTAVARVVKAALFNVVEKGTARRVDGIFSGSDGTAIPIGGKTGTGDHQYKVYGTDGKLVSSRAVNRTATFAFIIGDRFFGNITAYVAGPQAADYTFTSSFPLAVLKNLSSSLIRLVTSEEGDGVSTRHLCQSSQSVLPVGNRP